ncbi:hypothetical protein C8J57DRAFT_1219240 [Mycena rebaudengoi]|nr:hypothetical protein C8J57DRAFT_1219240 [Mycena rebaudengoi]
MTDGFEEAGDMPGLEGKRIAVDGRSNLKNIGAAYALDIVELETRGLQNSSFGWWATGKILPWLEGKPIAAGNHRLSSSWEKEGDNAMRRLVIEALMMLATYIVLRESQIRKIQEWDPGIGHEQLQTQICWTCMVQQRVTASLISSVSRTDRHLDM